MEEAAVNASANANSSGRESLRIETPLWSRLLILILAVQLPLLLLFYRSFNQVREQINESIAANDRAVLSVFRASLSDDLHAADRFLQLLSARAYDEAALSQTVTALLNDRKSLSAIFVADPTWPEPQLYLQSERGSYPEEEMRSLRSLAGNCLSPAAQNEFGWRLEQCAGGCAYLVRTVWLGDTLYGVAVDLQTITYRSQSEQGMENPVVFLKNDQPLTTARWYESYAASGASGAPGSYIRVGDREHQYIIVSSGWMGMQLLYAAYYRYDWRWLYTFGVLVVLASVAVTVGSFLTLRRHLFRPLDGLLETMEQVRGGEVTARARPLFSREFAVISDTFNEMLDRIQDLRVESYEKELAATHAQTDALRLQIRRHFFLNCLKSIYNMTLSGEVNDVQQMILLLSTHLRYTLDISHDRLPLRDELRVCQNYIELQSVGQPLPPQLTVQTDEGILDLQIPPISLLTLLENCCKYGVTLDRPLSVTITARWRVLDDAGFAALTVQDNGPGFGDALAARLNNALEQMSEEGHTGIVNVLTRLRLLYGPECSMLFVDRAGARVEILIPVPPGEWGGPPLPERTGEDMEDLSEDGLL